MIDTFHRIRSLKSNGVKIHLHCFENRKGHQKILDEFCEKVYYYPRKKGLISNLSIDPYNVTSRSDFQLLNRLQKDDFPILFDGVHTAYFLPHQDLKARKKIVRAHNIEHSYYLDHANLEKKLWKSLYYRVEALRFKWYEKVLSSAEKILAISESDNKYFLQKFGNAELIWPFHPFEKVVSKTGTGGYVLYHGNLMISENTQIVKFLAHEVFSKLEIKIIIAGMHPSPSLFAETKNYSNIEIIPDPDQDKMFSLINNAQITIPMTADSNGLKLKLLYSLFAGRHCIANTAITTGNPLSSLCHIADTAEETIQLVKKLFDEPMTNEEIENRQFLMSENFSNELNCQKIIKILYP